MLSENILPDSSIFERTAFRYTLLPGSVLSFKKRDTYCNINILDSTIEAAELKDELKKGKLGTGKKKELQNRLRAFIALEIEHGEDEEEGGEEDKEDEDEELDYFETRIIVDSRSAHLLKFSDMKESRSTLSGDKNINVQS
jgi:hypothetical protein